MTKLMLICVGKMKERFYLEAAAEYVKRISAFCSPDICELPEARLAKNPSAAEIERALEREAAAVLDKLPKGAFSAAMCIEGEPVSSEAFAGLISRASAESKWGPVFILGGSNGLHNSVKTAASVRISMSGMTFPHHLARVMLLEQVYRGFSINQGTKYHK